MAGSVNKVILIGNLGKDPEVKYFEEGRGFAKFPLATTESYRDKQGEKVEQTEWHNVTVWRPGLVDLVEKYLKKGNKVYLEGRLRTRSWEDDSNQTKYITEIVVDNMTFLGSPNSDQNSQQSQASASSSSSQSTQPTAQADKPDVEEDDLPF